jgi:GNAT superfamily N-acetyltransferase
MTLTVRPIDRQDISTLSHCFKRAFEQDPVMRWVFSPQTEWERCALRYFNMVIRNFIHSGHAVTTQGLEGAALWLKPDPPKGGVLFWSISYLKMAWLYRGCFLRGIQIEEALHKIHPKEPHWYLSVIGTDTLHRGKGVGPALLQPILKICDEQGLPAYLESSNQLNISFYIRHGFEILQDVIIPGGPTLWPMLRQPRNRDGDPLQGI